MNSLRNDAIWVYLHPCLNYWVEGKWRRVSYVTRVGIRRNGGLSHMEWRRESDEMAGGGDVIDGGLGDVGAGLGEGGP